MVRRLGCLIAVRSRPMSMKLWPNMVSSLSLPMVMKVHVLPLLVRRVGLLNIPSLSRRQLNLKWWNLSTLLNKMGWMHPKITTGPHAVQHLMGPWPPSLHWVPHTHQSHVIIPNWFNKWMVHQCPVHLHVGSWHWHYPQWNKRGTNIPFIVSATPWNNPQHS